MSSGNQGAATMDLRLSAQTESVRASTLQSAEALGRTASVRRKPIARTAKRVFDVISALSALVVLSPVFAVIALIGKLDGGPAFFVQDRYGMNGKTFRMVKFRSMRVNAEAHLKKLLEEDPIAAAEWRSYQKLKCDPRITPLGAILRKTSIDELPQLLNVLRGDMSLVGPRPMLIDQVAAYGPSISEYVNVRPGITGKWQVGGRNETTFRERAAIDAGYVKNWTFWGDIAIILKTIPALLSSKNAY